jgi:hypothetical protein
MVKANKPRRIRIMCLGVFRKWTSIMRNARRLKSRKRVFSVKSRRKGPEGM